MIPAVLFPKCSSRELRDDLLASARSLCFYFLASRCLVLKLLFNALTVFRILGHFDRFRRKNLKKYVIKMYGSLMTSGKILYYRTVKGHLHLQCFVISEVMKPKYVICCWTVSYYVMCILLGQLTRKPHTNFTLCAQCRLTSLRPEKGKACLGNRQSVSVFQPQLHQYFVSDVIM